MTAPTTVLVTGATGLVGGRLVPSLLEDGRRVLAATRSPERARFGPGVEAVGWDGVSLPAEVLGRCDALVHLAGEPLFGGPFNAARRRRVRDSRVDSTRALAAALAALPADERPAVWLCASAVGFYGSRGDESLSEQAGPGRGFLAELCGDWEAATRPAAEAGVRVVNLRIGIALAREGGALALMRRPFALGLGGRLGDGQQWVPWIQLDDLVALLRFALDEESLCGPLNAVGPAPARNAELTIALSRVLRRPALIPVPGFAIRLALGELADELLGSKRVLPERALAAGFRFAHPELEEALAAELR
ncbi:MAG: TIGR01777 family oxidoreductase [Deltaproteobacteria bacterium]|nr:TIGR01777 family oxidoreductase [Deltaproteobacteria bacterium]